MRHLDFIEHNFATASSPVGDECSLLGGRRCVSPCVKHNRSRVCHTVRLAKRNFFEAASRCGRACRGRPGRRDLRVQAEIGLIVSELIGRCCERPRLKFLFEESTRQIQTTDGFPKFF